MHNMTDQSKRASGTVRVGVDTGGTFTDVVGFWDGGLKVHKLRSTPDDPSRAILEGVRELVGGASGAVTAVEMTHGSTVATNALLERKGARVAMVTTAGFEDVLLIGRQTRAELYNFQVVAPRPLIGAGMTVGVAERLGADGVAVEELTDAEMERVVEAVKRLGPDSVAVCLLHSYANAGHEERLARVLGEAGFAVSASHAVLPEYREFERFSTTAVNAYVTPLMARYLGRLEDGLGVESGLRIMQSNGGSISAGAAKQAAVQTILSGPAAGVVGAQAMGAASGFARVIAFDMGGTSTDVSLIDGEIGRTSDSVVGDFPVRLPVLDIHTVGAGGGSVAWVDSGGSLRVGPRSAGAQPGPACYGVGDEMTVTDAHLLLGRLDEGWFLGGRMKLDGARARGIAKALGKRLGLSERALAEGIVRIANSNMERAVRKVSVQRGYDPREFALIAFGGAGGLHACDLAGGLDMGTVLIPEHSGVLSALGMLLADVVKDYSASVLRASQDVSYGVLERLLQPLRERALAELRGEGFAEAEVLLTSTLEMRYRGQAYEIGVPFGEDFEAAFHRAHLKLYGYASSGRATEIVQLRVKAVGRTRKPEIARVAVEEQALPSPAAIRHAVFGKKHVPTAVYYREQLGPGMSGMGPAIVVTGQSTNVVPPGWAWQIDAVGTLVATRGVR